MLRRRASLGSGGSSGFYHIGVLGLGSGFRVQGLGFKVQGLGFRV